jgi:dienelactone hydrolase
LSSTPILKCLLLPPAGGADQELEACCTWLSDHGWIAADPELRTARRPKPPSLKEQALGAVGRFTVNDHTSASEMMRDFDIIRRALEALPND